MPVESITEWFDNSFKKFASEKAISFFRDGELETQLTYAQLSDDINCFANFLASKGLEKNNRVILLLEKSLLSVIACLALFKMGVVAIPLNPGFKKDELDYLVNDSDPSIIITDNEALCLVCKEFYKKEILQINTGLAYHDIDFFRSHDKFFSSPKILKNDPGLVIYTSGTTGNPKGAVLTHGNLVSDAANVILVWDICKQDVLCHALPLFHVHGLCFALFTSLLSGAHVIMLDKFQPLEVCKRLSSKSPGKTCTIFMAVPAMYTKLLDALEEKHLDFSHVRLWTSGSAPLLEKEFDRITRILGKNPVEREGMSETGMNFSNPLNGKKKPGSIGIPMPEVQVRIVDPETGQDVEPGEVGEIWLKSLSIIKEYWQKPDETQKAFENGWFKTGDLGKKDREGYYYLTDRIKHLIITGGENVSAKEVEIVINRIQGVKEAAVVGIPDKTWGEKVVALVEAMPGANLSESTIISACKEKLHNLKCPKNILFSDHIPKNTMGKVLKDKVKQFFL